MAWICEYCSTNNDDETEECFVCGRKKPVKVSREKMFLTKVTKSISERKNLILSLIMASIMIISFVLGQVLSYLEYDSFGRILVISNMVSASQNYDFNHITFLVLTTIIGIVALIGHIMATFEFVSNKKYFIAVAITLVCGISIAVLPSVISLVMAMFSFIFCFKFKIKTKIFFAILYILAVVTIIISMPIIWEVWWIYF